MKMYKIIEWFVKNYPTYYKELNSCDHTHFFDAPNPYHLEGNCWAHIVMVCKMAEYFDYETEVKIAALLHDIGKPKSRVLQDKKVKFSSHEEISHELSKPIVQKMAKNGIIKIEQIDTILNLILYHGIIYKINGFEDLKEFNFSKDFLIKLLKLVRCDNLGRFNKDVYKEDKKILGYLKLALV